MCGALYDLLAAPLTRTATPTPVWKRSHSSDVTHLTPELGVPGSNPQERTAVLGTRVLVTP